MNTFIVPDMSCGGCASKITSALLQLDSKAIVNIDVATKHVQVSSERDEDELIEAITRIGFEVNPTAGDPRGEK